MNEKTKQTKNIWQHYKKRLQELHEKQQQIISEYVKKKDDQKKSSLLNKIKEL